MTSVMSSKTIFSDAQLVITWSGERALPSLQAPRNSTFSPKNKNAALFRTAFLKLINQFID